MQDDLIIRHLTGETSTEEEKQLLIWMAQLPANENHYHEVKKVFELSSNHFIQNAKQEIDINVEVILLRAPLHLAQRVLHHLHDGGNLRARVGANDGDRLCAFSRRQ